MSCTKWRAAILSRPQCVKNGRRDLLNYRGTSHGFSWCRHCHTEQDTSFDIQFPPLLEIKYSPRRDNEPICRPELDLSIRVDRVVPFL